MAANLRCGAGGSVRTIAKRQLDYQHRAATVLLKQLSPLEPRIAWFTQSLPSAG